MALTANPFYRHGLTGLKLCVLLYCLHTAYTIRLHAINDYGLVIHEFDPWFNYRATEYLYTHTLTEFFQWFDYKSWYPLGRPVGTTIYPGLQITSVLITNFLGWFVPLVGLDVSWALSLNDVCCYVPAWFGSIATFFTALITHEVSGSLSAAVCSSYIMAIVPAHLMRSIGGGYDNESIALTAMLVTFYFHLRSLRNAKSWPFGFLTGLAYVYMVAAWGGYVFVLNMVGLHVAALVLLGRFTPSLHKSYSLFFVIGTFGAIQIPVVGLTPLKSLEQLGPCFVFLGLQVIAVSEYLVNRQKATGMKKWFLRGKIYMVCGLVGLLAIAALTPTGYFGPLSSRVRGLFVRHTRTGNPLVDSVAEHQPASSQAYYQYLNVLVNVSPLGLVLCIWKFNNQKLFVVLYAAVAYFFSAKMVRLIILTGPVASVLSGWVLGVVGDWGVRQILDGKDKFEEEEEEVVGEKKSNDELSSSSSSDSLTGNRKEGKKNKKDKKAVSPTSSSSSSSAASDIFSQAKSIYSSENGHLVRKLFAFTFFFVVWTYSKTFTSYCNKMAVGLSNPSIMFKAQLRNGETIIVDDYREAYFWLEKNTPEDARVMAWWDYGYQITGIANRTTVADGNTWNHEHIALLGKALTSPEKEAHRIARHLADYVLIWTGGGGDDLAKSPHMARIANSVYRDICPGDPTCRQFGFQDKYGTPTPMMEASLLYRLSGHKHKPGVTVDPNRFREVFASKYGKVRIFKILGVSEESKAWVAEPSNRVCDVEGGWYCRGVYPPALEGVLSKKQDFAQLEDFNKKKKVGGDEDYQKAYHDNLADPKKRGAVKTKKNAKEEELQKKEVKEEEESKSRPSTLTKEELLTIRDQMSTQWSDSPTTTRLWEHISKNEVSSLKEWFVAEPTAPFARSSDGRGPMFWAYEYKREEIIRVLLKAGVKFSDKDNQGKTARDML